MAAASRAGIMSMAVPLPYCSAAHPDHPPPPHLALPPVAGVPVWRPRRPRRRCAARCTRRVLRLARAKWSFGSQRAEVKTLTAWRAARCIQVNLSSLCRSWLGLPGLANGCALSAGPAPAPASCRSRIAVQTKSRPDPDHKEAALPRPLQLEKERKNHHKQCSV